MTDKIPDKWGAVVVVIVW